MRTGAEFAFDQGADAIIFMDADCQHDPKEFPEFANSLTRGTIWFLVPVVRVSAPHWCVSWGKNLVPSI